MSSKTIKAFVTLSSGQVVIKEFNIFTEDDEHIYCMIDLRNNTNPEDSSGSEFEYFLRPNLRVNSNTTTTTTTTNTNSSAPVIVDNTVPTRRRNTSSREVPAETRNKRQRRLNRVAESAPQLITPTIDIASDDEIEQEETVQVTSNPENFVHCIVCYCPMAKREVNTGNLVIFKCEFCNDGIMCHTCKPQWDIRRRGCPNCRRSPQLRLRG